jgi:hypothetical protein
VWNERLWNQTSKKHIFNIFLPFIIRDVMAQKENVLGHVVAGSLGTMGNISEWLGIQGDIKTVAGCPPCGGHP